MLYKDEIIIQVNIYICLYSTFWHPLSAQRAFVKVPNRNFIIKQPPTFSHIVPPLNGMGLSKNYYRLILQH